MAPDFTLESTTGGTIRLYTVLKESPVVLFFYAKAFTPLCMAEVCGFRDAADQFNARNAAVFGISSDAPEAANRFAAHHNLPYPLLIDEGGGVRKLFGVPKLFGVLPGRATYVIGRDHVIEHITVAGLRSGLHISESLEWLNGVR